MQKSRQQIAVFKAISIFAVQKNLSCKNSINLDKDVYIKPTHLSKVLLLFRHIKKIFPLKWTYIPVNFYPLYALGNFQNYQEKIDWLHWWNVRTNEIKLNVNLNIKGNNKRLHLDLSSTLWTEFRSQCEKISNFI